MSEPLAEIAFPIPLRRFFDYRIPPPLIGQIQVGQRVWAPLGRRVREMGMVTRLHEPEADGWPPTELKFLQGEVDPDPVLSPRDLALAQWMSQRYACSPGEALFTVFPLGRRKPPRRPARETVSVAESPAFFEPTGEQSAALEKIFPALQAHQHKRFLLQGVAASGKTEVYRRTISAVLDRGQSAILLVPEIGLTPQMERRLRGWFTDALDIWHSEMSDGDRWRVWRRAREGRGRVVVGPRSALFLPLTNLGVIILDEEHDPSYKQDNAPHYHARDTAEEKARLHSAVLLLGSATPSLETHARADRQEIDRLRLSRRVEDRPFPTIRLVDMGPEGWYFSNSLIAALRDRLAKGEQSLLFLNRRGYCTQTECKRCGWVARCPECQVSLVLHRTGREGPTLRCHTCDRLQKPTTQCPSCMGEVLKMSGRGTERVAADLATLFPSARCLRWDRDAVTGRNGHERVYKEVLEGRVDIIIGTQMIVQGHDFPGLTLVGVLDADRSLSFPDFRAAERTFQLLMQVAGRAGRAQRPGEVLIQTRSPQHYALRAVLERNYDAFAADEMAYRREAAYPPLTRLAHALVRARSAQTAETVAEALRRWVQTPSLPAEAALLGPAPAFHPTKAGWAQWQLAIKSPAESMASLVARGQSFVPPKGALLSWDIDPEAMA